MGDQNQNTKEKTITKTYRVTGSKAEEVDKIMDARGFTADEMFSEFLTIYDEMYSDDLFKESAATVRQAIDLLRGAFSSAQTAVATKVAGLERDVEKEAEKYQGVVHRLQNDLEGLESKHKELKSNYDSQSTDLLKSQGEKQLLTDEFAALEKKAKGAQETISKLTNRLDTALEKQGTAEEEAKEARKAESQAIHEKEQKEREFEKQSNELEAANHVIGERESQIKDLSQQLEQEKEAHQVTSNEKSKCEGESKQLTKQVSSLETKNEKFEGRVDELSKELLEKHTEATNLENQVNWLKDEHKRLLEMKERLQEKIKELEPTDKE